MEPSDARIISESHNGARPIPAMATISMIVEKRDHAPVEQFPDHSQDVHCRDHDGRAGNDREYPVEGVCFLESTDEDGHFSHEPA